MVVATLRWRRCYSEESLGLKEVFDWWPWFAMEKALVRWNCRGAGPILSGRRRLKDEDKGKFGKGGVHGGYTNKLINRGNTDKSLV